MGENAIPNDQTPVDQMDANSAILDVVNREIGNPDDPTPAPESTPTPAPDHKVQITQSDDPSHSPTPEADPDEPTGLDIPAELMKKNEPAPADSDPNNVSVDPTEIDLNLVDPKIRPNLTKMRNKLEGQAKDIQNVTAERDALKAQLANATAGNPEDVKKWETEKAQLLDQVAAANLERDPRFIEKYSKLIAPVAESLKTTIESYRVEGLNSEEAINQAAKMNASDRAKFLAAQLPEEIAQTALSTLLPVFAQLDVIQNTRNAELENHKATQEEIEKAGNVESQEKLAELRANAKVEALKKFTGNEDRSQNEMLLTKVDGNTAWNSKVDVLTQSIDALFETSDPAIHAEALVLSRLAPIYKQGFMQERLERERLEGILKDRNISIPKLSDSPAPSGKPAVSLENLTEESAAKMVSASLPA